MHSFDNFSDQDGIILHKSLSNGYSLFDQNKIHSKHFTEAFVKQHNQAIPEADEGLMMHLPADKQNVALNGFDASPPDKKSV